MCWYWSLHVLKERLRVKVFYSQISWYNDMFSWLIHFIMCFIHYKTFRSLVWVLMYLRLAIIPTFQSGVSMYHSFAGFVYPVYPVTSGAECEHRVILATCSNQVPACCSHVVINCSAVDVCRPCLEPAIDCSLTVVHHHTGS